MHTSRQDTYQIKDFCSLFKADYEKRFQNNKLAFRLIVSDYSWAAIHALIQTFNTESVVNYSDRVFNYCINNLDFNLSELSWYISCAAHTMHRYSRGVNKIFKDKETCKFVCFVFSLMLNCDNIQTLGKLFMQLCVVFQSKTMSEQFIEAYNFLVGKIENRDSFNDSDDFEKKIYFEKKTDKTANIKQTKAVKDQSKFGQYFRDLESSVKINENSSDANDLYCPKFIEFLQKYFMPYCFLWAGFVLKGTNITRLTNGALEKYFAHKKKKITSPLYPAEYVNHTFLSTKGKAIEFTSKSNDYDNVEDDDDNNNLINNVDDFDDDVDSEEISEAEAAESWKKPRTQLEHLKNHDQILIINCKNGKKRPNDRKKQEGFFQKPFHGFKKIQNTTENVTGNIKKKI
jgi:hypothetical protein